MSALILYDMELLLKMKNKIEIGISIPTDLDNVKKGPRTDESYHSG